MKELTEKIIGAAIEVHRTVGPGLLESAYEECLAHEMELCGLNYEREDSFHRRGAENAENNLVRSKGKKGGYKLL